jgi:hypothetical protein
MGEASQQERSFLPAPAKEGFPYEEVIYPLIVDGHVRVRVKPNWYSAASGLRLSAVVKPS